LGVLRDVPHEPRPPHARLARRTPVREVLTRPDILMVFCAFVLVFAAHAMNTMNLPLTITRELGGSAGHVGITFGIGPVAELPLMLWFGLLATRGHQLGLIRLGGAITIAYFAGLYFVQAPWQV